MNLPFGGPASEMRPRARTLPTDVLRKLHRGRKLSKESSPNHSGGTTPRRNGSNKATHSPTGTPDRTTSSHDLAHMRLDTKLWNGSSSPGGNNSPRLQRAHSDKHPRSKGVPLIVEPDAVVLTTDKFIDMCIHVASDESLAVHREPLPRGSMAYERVMRDLEPDVIQATNKTLLSVDSIDAFHIKRHNEQCSSAPSSPKCNRHVHFRK